jgi:hypothetical protein
VTVMGTVWSLAVFISSTIVAYLSLKILGRFPTILFRMIECYGIAILFDWALSLAESIFFGYYLDDWDNDSFKLWNYFQRAEGNGVVGAFLTVFLYLFMVGVTLFFLYNYVIFIHMNGRLIDVYSRLTAPESSFFMPNDSEVSLRYFNDICHRANTYRSLMGET